jgi:hypothetical protein
MKVPDLIRHTGQRLLREGGSRALAEYYHALQTRTDSRYRTGQRRMAVLKDKHRGERCFIIGNGPSLQKTDLSRLRNESTFGLNRIYLLFERLGFSTTYFVSINRFVIEQCAREIERLPCPKFISWSARDLIEFTDDMMFLRRRTHAEFSTDITRGIWEGTTVTFTAMQIAYYLGFETVVLVGVDHSFVTKGEPHKLVVSQGNDPNHFDAGYFGKGFRWQLPDLETSEMAYKIARRQFESGGRKIVDATIGGKLQVFPKVDYLSLFD